MVEETAFDREYCDGLFAEHTKIKVVFTKKNGGERIMLCTNNFDIIPEENHPKKLAEGEDQKPPNEDVRTVFDLEAGGWRSFIYKNVISTDPID